MKTTVRGLLFAGGIVLLAGCATAPQPLDPNAQVPPPNHPAPVQSQIESSVPPAAEVP